MQQVSADFLAEIRRDHVVYSYADVITPTGQTTRLQVMAGSVDVDRTADVRRRAQLTIVDSDHVFTPLNAQSALAPFGSMLKVYRGVRYTTGVLAGSTEVVPLGVFRLSDASVKATATGDSDISVDAYDLSRTISRAKFTAPWNIPQGTNCITAAKAIIARTIKDPQYDTFSSSTTTAAAITYDTSDDPWQAVNTLASAAGCECYFKADGSIKIAPPIDVNHLPAPVFTYIEGPGCTMTELDVQLSDDPGYNGVVVIGQAAGDATAPVRSVVWDTEPTSPTYHLGPYGEVPMIVSSSVVTTQTDADAAALAQLNLVLGFYTKLGITAMVNPALDANDVIAVQRKDSGVDSSFAVDAFSVPLDVGTTQSLTLRQKRTV